MSFHSLTLGGIKESKVTNDEFARAQKQWAKYYKKVQGKLGNILSQHVYTYEILGAGVSI